MGNESSTSKSRAPQKTSTVSAGASPLAPAGVRLARNLLLVCLDSSIDDYQRSLAEWRTSFNTIYTDAQLNRCLDFILDNKHENICIITSALPGKKLIPHVHDMLQIDCIYVLCNDAVEHERWAAKWSKIRGVFADIQSLGEALRQQTRPCNRDSTSITITNTNGSDELEPAFIRSTLLRECIVNVHFAGEEICRLANACRELYRENLNELQIIDEFEGTYRSDTSIGWYTRDCFIHNLLHRALCKLEISAIMLMGFFIKDLHSHIEQLHSEQRHLFSGGFHVYRGQDLLEADFAKLCASEGGLLSFNHFLTTSKNQDVALTLANKARAKPRHVAVVFRFTVHPCASPSSPYAIVDGKGEEEILFSTNSTFRIGRAQQLDKDQRLYEIQLTRTSKDDEQLSAFTDPIRKDIADATGWHRLGELLFHLDDTERACALYKTLLQDTSTDNEKEILLLNSQLGKVHQHAGYYSKALEYYKKNLDISQKTLPPTHADLARIYHDIGSVYFEMQEHMRAFEYHDKCLEIRRKTLPPTHLDLATSYDSIGVMQYSMGEYSKALGYYEKSLEIQRKALPATHIDLATSYNNIGRVYSCMKEHAKALYNFEKSLEIRKAVLPPTHLHLTASYNSIAGEYSAMGEDSKALEYHNKSGEIMRERRSTNAAHSNHKLRPVRRNIFPRESEGERVPLSQKRPENQKKRSAAKTS